MNSVASHAPADYRHRPERVIKKNSWLEKLQIHLKGWVELSAWRLRLRRHRFIKQVSAYMPGCELDSDPVLIERAQKIGEMMRCSGFSDPLVAELFAIIREMSGRILGMKHFNSQLTGGWIMLQGRVAEMKTGEGKTLTAVLPVISAGLAGLPVHVVSVNDYLVERDAQEMAPLYQQFGLSVGVITHQVELSERRQVYQQDIVYVTGKELVFDYLRDRMKMDNSQPLRMQVEALKNPKLEKKLQLRGLHFALVDEVDSVLIDESRTPLIISSSQGNKEEEEFIETAFHLSADLKLDEDYTVDKDRREIDLTETGRESLRQLVVELGPLWKGAIRREEVIHKALMARLIYQRDKDYLVRDGKVELIDPLSGRIMEGRSWEGGLHQLVELKEECELTQQRVTLARISYQNFFRRYLYLSGMTGTAWEIRKELWRVYRLAVSPVPTHRLERREIYSSQIWANEEQRWAAIVERCSQLVAEGRAVLIGTDSVANSEMASEYLKQAGITHRVLSAKQDKEEADVVAEAGLPGRVTVATSMAGRGTDIKLAPSVEKAGGLHVIQTQHYESARVDRQLAGRCARQGDQGSYELLLSLEDQPLRTLQAKSLLATAKSFGVDSQPAQKLAMKALQLEQQFIERQNHLARQSTLEYDLKQHELLAFSGCVD